MGDKSRSPHPIYSWWHRDFSELCSKHHVLFPKFLQPLLASLSLTLPDLDVFTGFQLSISSLRSVVSMVIRQSWTFVLSSKNYFVTCSWPPWNSNTEDLTSQCDSIGRWGLWEIIRYRWGHEGRGPPDGISVFRRRGKETRALSSPCEDTVRRCLPVSQGKDLRSPKARPQWCPDLELSNLQNWKKLNFYCLRPPVNDILL